MADDPKSDLSSLADEIPSPIDAVSITRSPVATVDPGDTKGETKRTAVRPDGRPVGIPTKIHSTLTGQQQLREALCRKYPCAACKHAQFPKPGSAEHATRAAFVAMFHGKLGIWKDLGEDAFLYCEDDPTNGKGFKFLGYNCPAWRERTAEFLPEWVPTPVLKAVEFFDETSRKLRRIGIAGLLRGLRGGR